MGRTAQAGGGLETEVHFCTQSLHLLQLLTDRPDVTRCGALQTIYAPLRAASFGLLSLTPLPLPPALSLSVSYRYVCKGLGPGSRVRVIKLV